MVYLFNKAFRALRAVGPTLRRVAPTGRSRGRKAKRSSSQRVLTADFRRFSQKKIRTFHRRDAEYAEEIPFAQSGDDDWAKSYSSNLKNVFVCRRLPTNKNLILCALCASAVIFLKGILSVSICVNLRLIALDTFSTPLQQETNLGRALWDPLESGLWP